MIRVLQWGLGAMGSGIAKNLSTKEGIEIVGAVDRNEQLVGKDLGDFLGVEEMGIAISNDVDQVIEETYPDLAVIATHSFMEVVFDHIMKCVENKINVVTIAEEMAYPFDSNPEQAEIIDKMARKNGVTVLGTGVNPGFVLDQLILNMTGACLKVDKIKAQRVNDLSPFGKTVMETQGVGTTVEQFNKGIEEGTIVGHIGFQQSIQMIADYMGWPIDRIEEEREPIVSNTKRETPIVKVEPGMVAGCRHIGRGYCGDELLIELIHPQQIHPEVEDVDTGDYIWISGDPDISLSIKPEIPGGKGTMALASNMVPIVYEWDAGLFTMADLPIPVCLTDRI